MINHNDIRFFLGSNTKHGFVPLFNQLRDPVIGKRLYILKGGPGSGKSSLMRRIAKALVQEGHTIEYIPCASDPMSLDAILDRDAGFAMVDGTAPHTMDPSYPGAYDVIINMGSVWDDNILKHYKQDIIELSDTISQCHSMATSCITAAAALLEANKKLADRYVNNEAVALEASRIIEELEDSPTGKEHKRLLSAVSVDQLVFFEDTISSLCSKQYVITDDWGAASTAFMTNLHCYAMSKSLDVITCYDSIQNPDKIDHLLFPKAGIAITTSNSFHSCNYENSISIEGLMKPIEIMNISIMARHLSMSQSLIDNACSHITRAKQLHDNLESYYITAMDFSKVDTIYDQIIEEIRDITHKKNKIESLFD